MPPACRMEGELNVDLGLTSHYLKTPATNLKTESLELGKPDNKDGLHHQITFKLRRQSQ